MAASALSSTMNHALPSLRQQRSTRFLLILPEYLNPATFRQAYHQTHHSQTTTAQKSLQQHVRLSRPRCTTLQSRHLSTTSSSASAPAPPPPPSVDSSTQSAPKSYYTLFPQSLPQGPPPTGPFSINARALRTEFLRLQSLYHPDRHPTSASKSQAEGTSALVNEAYRTLLSPLLRAQYLLKLRGIDVGEDEGAKVEDMELLEEVMEIRSVIEGAEEEGELTDVRRENGERIEACVKELERAFANDDMQEAEKVVVRLRYWENVRESLDGWEKGKAGVIMH